MASNPGELAKQRAEVDPARTDPYGEPSAEWGWHGGFPKGTIFGGVFTIIACAAFLIGPYQSRTQDLWLIGVIVVVLVGMVVSVRKKRNAWRR